MAVAVTIDIRDGTARLIPATQRVGDPPPEVAFFPVHKLIRNSS